MAFKTTIKVAMLTGAAKDDVFTTESTGLSEDLLTSALNVLGNDPGSASLYSLAQESLGTGQMPVEGTAYSLVLKAKITIRPDGRIDYDGDAIASTLAHFAEGAIITDSFTYTVRMANGALSTAMVTLEITGENDAPTLRSIDPVTLWDSEADKYAYTVDGNYIDRLHSNPLPISVDVQAVDAIGATSAVQTIMINFEAANDVPLFSGQDSATVIEGDVALVQRKLGVTDPDTQFGFKPIEPADLTGTYGVFTFNRKSGDWTYKLNNESPLVTDLTANDEKTDVLTVYWSTGESHDLSVKVKGIDAPTTPIDPVKTFFFTPRFDQVLSTTYGDFTNNDFLKLGLNITIDHFSRASLLGPNGVVEAGTLIDLSMSGGTAESPEKAEFTIFLAGCTDFSLDQASNLTT